MRPRELEPKVEFAAAENQWPRLAAVFLVAPSLWLLSAHWFGQRVILGWLVIAVAYAVVLLVGAKSQASVVNGSRRMLEISRAVVAGLSPLFWGGALATSYWFLYLLLFDCENFFPR